MTEDDPIPRTVLNAIPRNGTITLTLLVMWTGLSLNSIRGALVVLRNANLIARRPGTPIHPGPCGRSWDWRRL